MTWAQSGTNMRWLHPQSYPDSSPSKSVTALRQSEELNKTPSNQSETRQNGARAVRMLVLAQEEGGVMTGSD